MNTKDAAEALHKEHEEMAGLLAQLESGLGLVASGDDESRSQALAGLRKISEQTSHIRECLRGESATANSAAFFLADPAERARLKEILFHLERSCFEFRKELAFTTTLSTEDLLARGQHLVGSLREQIAYEQALLRRVEATLLDDGGRLGSKE